MEAKLEKGSPQLIARIIKILRKSAENDNFSYSFNGKEISIGVPPKVVCSFTKKTADGPQSPLGQSNLKTMYDV